MIDDLLEKMRNACLQQPVPNNVDIFCPPIFDDLNLCWNFTKGGSETFQNCPDIEGFNKNEMASKKCEPDGTWYVNDALNRTWTDFQPCIKNVSNLDVYIYFAGYSLSVFCMAISLFIFFYFKKLQCERVFIHKNLFISYIINAITWMTFLAVISKPTVMVENPGYCQMLYVIATFFNVSTYFWTFSEGLYLATVLVMAFQDGSKKLVYLCIFFGWGLPFILTIFYASLRYQFENPEKCWTVKTNMQKILIIPNIIALIANLIIVIVILKILLTKLWHPVNREQKQWRKTARAIFILFPVLGIQNILFFMSSDDRKVAAIQEFISGAFNSFQGVMMSFILCFCNNEVKVAVLHSATNNRRFRTARSASRRSFTKSDGSFDAQPKGFRNSVVAS